MGEVNVPEYVMVRADQLSSNLHSGRKFKAFERSAAILGFGALIWGGFFLYDLFSNTVRELEQRFSVLTKSPLAETEAVVNPAVLTEEGIAEAVRNFKGGPFFGKEAYELSLRAVAEKVNEAGVGTLTNAEVAFIKKAEGRLVKSGMLTQSMVVKVHPVDRCADFVIRDKNYWAIVLGLMVVPALPVVGEIVREAQQ